MSVTDYKVVQERDPVNMAATVLAAIGAGWQPFGSGFYDASQSLACQPMVKGVPDVNNNASAAASVLDGATVAVHNSAGADSHNATAEVSANLLTDVKFAATVAMVDDTDVIVVKNSAGTTVTGTHHAEVAVGVLTDVRLASTVGIVLNGGTLTGVTPSGVYATTITFTVASGVITAIALS